MSICGGEGPPIGRYNRAHQAQQGVSSPRPGYSRKPQSAVVEDDFEEATFSTPEVVIEGGLRQVEQC